MRNQLEEIGACRRLPSGEMQLQDAERIGFRENLFPGGGVEFRRTPVEVQGIGAIRALQRASMREFREKADRRGGRVHKSTTRLSAKSLRNASTSGRTSSGEAPKATASAADISSTLMLPSQRFRISTPISSSSKIRSGASSTHRSRTRSWRSRTPRGSRGLQFTMMSVLTVKRHPLG